jgi:hypothetical protein
LAKADEAGAGGHGAVGGDNVAHRSAPQDLRSDLARSARPLVFLLARNIRPQLADAVLVYLAERDGFDVIFTLDRRDFSVYHAGRKHAFRIIP